ncbi:hypothetical protein [Parazoarcus communis]|uniref:hypothetical protein n=1 Tax=Parazoarcus communis TaxID=41977 RepID=UPI00131F0268|nr:hypothetical protein [Parazoarcus communis]
MALLAELLAFIGGVLLLRPAFRLNGLMREAASLRGILEHSQARIDQETIPLVTEQLDDLGTSWNRWDELCLRGGAVMFVCSGAIKLALL